MSARHDPRSRVTGSVLFGSLVSTWGRRFSATSLVQRGTVAMAGSNNNTATITSIDTAQSSVKHLGGNGAIGGNSAQDWSFRLELTNATTVTFTRSTTDGTTYTVGYAVRSRPLGVLRSVQRGTIALTNATAASVTATITSVDLTKSICTLLGFKDTSADLAAPAQVRNDLTNATTVTTSRGAVATANNTTGYEVEEEN